MKTSSLSCSRSLLGSAWQKSRCFRIVPASIGRCATDRSFDQRWWWGGSGRECSASVCLCALLHMHIFSCPANAILLIHTESRVVDDVGRAVFCCEAVTSSHQPLLQLHIITLLKTARFFPPFCFLPVVMVGTNSTPNSAQIGRCVRVCIFHRPSFYYSLRYRIALQGDFLFLIFRPFCILCFSLRSRRTAGSVVYFLHNFSLPFILRCQRVHFIRW